MKKHPYLIILALALMAFLPVAVRAESGSSGSSDDDSVEVEIENETEDSDSDDSYNQSVIRERLRIKTENIELKEDIRTKLMNGRLASTTRVEIKDFRGDIRTIASTTRGERIEIREERREDVGDMRQEDRLRIKNASSTGERREIRKEMHKDIFKIRKDALVRQLNVSLNNLKQISDRIQSRIEKAEEAGKDMTTASDLLIIADAKIVSAEIHIGELAEFEWQLEDASSTDATASTTIDLTKPRQIGETAINAIKEAHKALIDVVRAVAHALGAGNNATTTPPTASSTVQ